VVLVGAGTASGIAAAVNAPLAGAFFALEEILGSLRVAAFPPIVMARVVGAVISRAVFGNHPAFPIPREYGYAALVEILVVFPLLGALCGVMSALFVRVHFSVGDLVRTVTTRLGTQAWLVPWLAGALVGAVAFASGGLLVGSGHLSIPLAAFGRMAWSALLLLTLGKVAITALTLQGGGSGGLFTPSLFVGAVAREMRQRFGERSQPSVAVRSMARSTRCRAWSRRSCASRRSLRDTMPITRRGSRRDTTGSRPTRSCTMWSAASRAELSS
jgi:chloride channel protein, CIC family